MGSDFHSPLFFMDPERVFTWRLFLRSVPDMLGFMMVFYLNYFFLIDKFLYKGKTREFIIYNFLLIVAVAFMMHYGKELLGYLMPHMRPRARDRRNHFFPWLFIVRNSTSLFLMAGLSVALKMTVRWFEVDNERKELEKQIGGRATEPEEPDQSAFSPQHAQQYLRAH